MTNQYSIDEIQQMILDVCESEFGESNNGRYFIVPNSTTGKVKEIILDRLKDKNIKKMKYIDMSVYVLQTGNDVFIDIT